MNTDLYQALTVALLGAITVLLIVAIASLGRLRKVLESATAISRDPAANPVVTDRAETPPAGTQEAPPAAGTSEPRETAPDAAREEERESAGARSVFTRPEEAGETAGSAERADTQQVEVVEKETSAEPEEPQEQPFERDGRWWFRRGEELLVYDEQTGQWLQVAGPPAGHAGSAPASEASGAVVTETRTVTETSTAGDQTENASSARSFWKCSSCGAINGAAATSCRMCFAARP